MYLIMSVKIKKNPNLNLKLTLQLLALIFGALLKIIRTSFKSITAGGRQTPEVSGSDITLAS